MKKKTMEIISAGLLLAALMSCDQKVASADEQAAPEAKANIVTLTKANLAQIDLDTMVVRRSDLVLKVKAAATLTEDLNQTARVTPTLEGRITSLRFDINDSVQQGDVLALLQTPEFLGKALELKAPIDGIVTERPATIGELAGKETPIYTISDPRDLWVIAEVKERDIAAIRLGAEATFRVLAYPDETFRGKVVRIGNRVESATRTLDIRIAVRNEDGRLKPGMFADAEIATTAVEDALLIPEQALQNYADGQVVFVALGQGKFEKRPVRVGSAQGDRLQVLEGLQEGEKIATEGSFILKSELLKGELGEE